MTASATYSTAQSARRAATNAGLEEGSFHVAPVDGRFRVVKHRRGKANSKKTAALKVFAKFGDQGRAVVIKKLKRLGLSDAGSNTYFYQMKNARWA